MFGKIIAFLYLQTREHLIRGSFNTFSRTMKQKSTGSHNISTASDAGVCWLAGISTSWDTLTMAVT